MIQEKYQEDDTEEYEELQERISKGLKKSGTNLKEMFSDNDPEGLGLVEIGQFLDLLKYERIELDNDD